MDEEKWLPVVGYEGLYEVSSHGNVKSLERYVKKTSRYGEIFECPIRQRILKNKIGVKRGSQYPLVVLCKNSKCKTIRVHILVCEAFIGKRPQGFDICHKDGVKTNNNIENLRYDSRSNNQQDRKLNNTYQYGNKNPNSKLTVEQVQEIYVLLNNTNTTYREISEKYNVNTVNIFYINIGRTWRLDSLQYPIRNINKRERILQ